MCIRDRVYRVGIREQGEGSPAAASTTASGPATEVIAQMPGAVYRVVAKVGDKVDEGQAIVILEAMKMEMEVPAPAGGTIQAINVAVGQQVTTGEVLATIQ